MFQLFSKIYPDQQQYDECNKNNNNEEVAVFIKGHR